MSNASALTNLLKAQVQMPENSGGSKLMPLPSFTNEQLARFKLRNSTLGVWWLAMASFNTVLSRTQEPKKMLWIAIIKAIKINKDQQSTSSVKANLQFGLSGRSHPESSGWNSHSPRNWRRTEVSFRYFQIALIASFQLDMLRLMRHRCRRRPNQILQAASSKSTWRFNLWYW